MRYLDTGIPRSQAEARTVVFVHGFCGSGRQFAPLFPALVGRVRCIALDLPGCGGSGKPDVRYTTAFFVDILDSFLRMLGVERVVLVGHSMGGQICLHFAHRFPGAVERLILIAPDGLAGEEGGWLAVTWLGPFLDAGLSLSNRSLVEIALRTVIVVDQSAVTPEVVDSFAEGLGTAEGVWATAEIARGVIGHDSVDAILPGIASETLVVWGEEDRLLRPVWGPRYVELMPRARLHRIPGCGHAPMLEMPSETARLLAAFLAR